MAMASNSNRHQHILHIPMVPDNLGDPPDDHAVQVNGLGSFLVATEEKVMIEMAIHYLKNEPNGAVHNISNINYDVAVYKRGDKQYDAVFIAIQIPTGVSGYATMNTTPGTIQPLGTGTASGTVQRIAKQILEVDGPPKKKGLAKKIDKLFNEE